MDTDFPSDEHLKAIGMVTAQWERLRSIVDVGTSALSEQQFQQGEEIIPYTDLRQARPRVMVSCALQLGETPPCA